MSTAKGILIQHVDGSTVFYPEDEVKVVIENDWRLVLETKEGVVTYSLGNIRSHFCGNVTITGDNHG